MTIAEDKIASGPSVPGPSWREADRLRALLAYDVLDTPPEKDFDDIAALVVDSDKFHSEMFFMGSF